MRAPLTIKGPAYGGDFAIIDADGQIIAETFGRSSTTHTHDARTNAQQFAAVPELLDAVEKAADTFADLARALSLVGRKGFAASCRVAETHMRATIDKATKWVV